MWNCGEITEFECAIAIESAIAAIEPGASPGSTALLAGSDSGVGGSGFGAGAALLAEVLFADDTCAAAGAAFAESGGVFGLSYKRSATLFAKIEMIRELNLARRAVHKQFSSAIMQRDAWIEGSITMTGARASLRTGSS